MIDAALCMLLEQCGQTGDLAHVPHAQAVLRRLHDDMVLTSFYDPGAQTIFIRAPDEREGGAS